MATQNLVGWETGDNTESVATAGTFSVQTTTVRSGTYALRVNPTTSGTGSCKYGATNTGSVNKATMYYSFYWRAATLPASTDDELCQLLDTSSAIKMTVRVNSSGNLVAYQSNGTTVLATGATVLTTGNWYLIQVKCGTGASAPWEVRVNLASEISGTSSNIGASNNGFILLGKATNRNSNTVDFFYDDFMSDDAAYPADSKIVVLGAKANGTYQVWTIGAGSGSHFQVVDEVPPNGDTDYLLSTLTAGDAETEALQTSGDLGITGTVNSVKSWVINKRDGASAGSFKIRFRSNTTDTDNAAQNSQASYTGRSESSTGQDTDPATSAAWTVSGLDTLEVGCVENSASFKTRMTWVGAFVAYTPTAGVGDFQWWYRQPTWPPPFIPVYNKSLWNPFMSQAVIIQDTNWMGALVHKTYIDPPPVYNPTLWKASFPSPVIVQDFSWWYRPKQPEVIKVEIVNKAPWVISPGVPPAVFSDFSWWYRPKAVYPDPVQVFNRPLWHPIMLQAIILQDINWWRRRPNPETPETKVFNPVKWYQWLVTAPAINTDFSWWKRPQFPPPPLIEVRVVNPTLWGPKIPSITQPPTNVVDWGENLAPTYYRVQRGTVHLGPYTTVGTTTGLVYPDLTPSPDTYYYVVQAVDKYGNISPNSNEATTTSVRRLAVPLRLVGPDVAEFITGTDQMDSAFIFNTSVPTLASGYQETGRFGKVDSDSFNGGTVSQDVNFKTVMTNVPSSITISYTAVNIGSTSIDNSTYGTFGFRVSAIPSSSGTQAGFYNGQYVTVGN